MDIKFNHKTIGKKHPVFIIAEGCDNHLGNVDVAIEMARQAKLAGADCIKFQHHIPDAEMLPDAPMSDNFREPLYDFLIKYSLTLDQHKFIKKYCEEIGILYLCTPFSFQAALELKSIGLEVFKIGSGEMTDLTSLQAIIGLNNPMIISTGMSTLKEIRETYQLLKKLKATFCFTNCVSEYPPIYEDMNLKVIPQLYRQFPDIVIGHSDHTPDLFTSFAAVALGAKIIEKHVILDKRIPGPDQSVSIDMKELAELVEGVRKVEAALGKRKKIHEKELPIRTWATRSVITTCDIPVGTILTEKMLWTKRPGTGIPSREMPKIIGKKTKKTLKANKMLKPDDYE